MPLFSSLDHGSFVRVVEHLERRRLAPDEVLVQAGKGADAIHIVARGQLRATREGDAPRPVVLAHLGPGEFLGEFTFLTGVPSPVSIVAEGEAEVLRISDELMRSIIADHPAVETVLWRFFVDRMIHSLLATSSLFQGLDRERQLEIGRRFEPMEVKAAAVVIEEGDAGTGLYLIVSGGVEVSVGHDSDRNRVASLAAGEFFGVQAAASGAVPNVRVTATKDSMILVLAGEVFRQVLEDEPSVKIAVETVTGMRRLLTEAMFQGRTAYAADHVAHG